MPALLAVRHKERKAISCTRVHQRQKTPPIQVTASAGLHSPTDLATIDVPRSDARVVCQRIAMNGNCGGRLIQSQLLSFNPCGPQRALQVLHHATPNPSIERTRVGMALQALISF